VRRAALTVAPGPLLSPATGEHGDIHTVRNVGATTCTLSGYPDVMLIAGTTTLGFRYVNGAGQYVTHRPPGVITLPPGINAYFLIAKYRCDAHTTAIATTAQIRLPEQRTTHVLATQTTSTEHGAAVLAYCTGNGDPDPGDTVAISPIADTVQRAAEN
jgi:hypothetical protein